MNNELASNFLAICIRSYKSGFRSDVANTIYNNLKTKIGDKLYTQYVLSTSDCKNNIKQLVELDILNNLINMDIEIIKPNECTKSQLISLIIPETRPLTIDNIKSRLEESGFNPFNPTEIDPENMEIINCIDDKNDHIKEIGNLIYNAESDIKISTLSPPEEGSAYYNMIVTALSAKILDNEKNNKEFSITFIFGNCSQILCGLTGVYFDEGTYINKIMDAIAKKIKKSKDNITNFSIKIASYNPSLFSWNHSKVIVIDNKTTIIGGQNMFSVYNNIETPHLNVHDTSIKIKNSEEFAIQADTYLNNLLNDCQSYAVFPLSSKKSGNHKKDLRNHNNNNQQQISNSKSSRPKALLIPTYGNGINSNEN